jgi:PadR family transcriptional regulator PadR
MKKCCAPDCCDMRGMLSFLIMWMLTKSPMHGKEISEYLYQRRGIKPSPGTLYPALKELKNRGLIKGEKKGKLIVYSLTDEGSTGVKAACKYFCHCFGEILEENSK